MKLQILTILLSFSILLVRAQTTDASGKKQGYWKKKDEKTNKLIYEGEFKDDKPVGKFKYYYANDSLQAIMNFRDNGKVAYAKLFHPTGKRMAEGKYINEIKDSIWLFYDEAGVIISKDKYVMGKKDGTCYVYLPDGALAEERNFKLGVEHGMFKFYFDGKKVRGQGNYVNGNLDGRVAYYFPNGTEVAAGYYKNGAKIGAWIYKDEKGKITEKEYYINGHQASKKETDEFFSKNKPKETVKTEPKKAAVKTQKKG